MMCKKPELSEKLVLFIENMLPDNEQAEIHAHLGECEHCNDEERALRENISLLREGALVESASSGTTACPDVDVLVTYEESPEKLIAKERKRLESHLTRCEECKEALALLKDSSRDLEAGPALSPARMPSVIREAVENLYGKPQKQGLIDMLLSVFNLRPGYSLLSALAVTLVIVGVLSLVFNDMPYQKASYVSRAPISDDSQALVNSAPGEGKQASVAGPAAGDESGRARRADGIMGNQDTKTFATSAPHREMESSSLFNKEKTQPGDAQSKDKNMAFSSGGGGASHDHLDINAKSSSSPGGLAASGERPAFSGAAPSGSGNKVTCGKTDSMKKTAEYEIDDDRVKEKMKDVSTSGSLKGSTDYRFQVYPPAAPSCREEAKHPAMTVRPHIGQDTAEKPQAAISKLSPEDQKTKLEHEMKASAQAYLDKILGAGLAEISVAITSDEKNETLSIKKVEVLVKSTRPITEKLQGDLKRSLSAKLKLKGERDRVNFMEIKATH